jgi:ABC-type siderophore export system fused ATPase/permease subunit
VLRHTTTDQRIEQLVEATVVLVLIYISMAIAHGIQSALFKATNERIAAHMRIEAFDSLLSQKVEYFDQTDAGEIWGRLSNDVNEMGSIMTAVHELSQASVLLIGSAIFLFTISWVWYNQCTIEWYCTCWCVTGIGGGVWHRN